MSDRITPLHPPEMTSDEQAAELAARPLLHASVDAGCTVSASDRRLRAGFARSRSPDAGARSTHPPDP